MVAQGTQPTNLIFLLTESQALAIGLSYYVTILNYRMLKIDIMDRENN